MAAKLPRSKLRTHDMRRLAALLFLCLAASLPLSAATASELIEQGRAALVRDDNDAAVELFTKAIELEPRNANAHYLLGMAYGDLAQRSGVLKQASMARKTKGAFETAAKLDPNHFEARLMLINYYLIAPAFLGGSVDKALEHATDIAHRNPLEGHRARARIYLYQKKNDLAQKEFVEAVRENPKNARAHHWLAGFYLNEKNNPAALHEIEMTLELDPTYMPAHLRLGAYAAVSGSDYERGTESLRKYLTYKPTESEPSLAAAWYWLGQIQEKQGKKKDAKASYANGLKLAPKDRQLNEALKKLG